MTPFNDRKLPCWNTLSYVFPSQRKGHSCRGGGGGGGGWEMEPPFLSGTQLRRKKPLFTAHVTDRPSSSWNHMSHVAQGRVPHNLLRHPWCRQRGQLCTRSFLPNSLPLNKGPRSRRRRLMLVADNEQIFYVLPARPKHGKGR